MTLCASVSVSATFVRERRKTVTTHRVSLLVIAFSGVCLLALLALLSCTADSNESGKSAATDASASSAAAPVAASSSAPTPAAAPTGSIPFDGRPVRSAPPDTTDYSKPAR